MKRDFLTRFLRKRNILLAEVKMTEENTRKPGKTNDSLQESFTHTRPDPTTQAPTLRRAPPANNGRSPTDASKGSAHKP